MLSLNIEEAGLSQLLRRLDPTSAELVTGASDSEIKLLAQIAGRPFPPFYQWFLRTMGSNMAGFGYARLDCSASTILRCYQDGLVPRSERYFLIGLSTNKAVPVHQFYDLERPARGDACVVETDDFDGFIEAKFETFREMLAWRNFLEFKVMQWSQHCRGLFKSKDDDILQKLRTSLASLGITSVLSEESGPYCALFDGEHCSIVSRALPEGPPRRHAFTMGAQEQGTLRRILGVITSDARLEVKRTDWTPRLDLT